MVGQETFPPARQGEAVSALKCVTQTRSLIKGRRLYMRSRKWRDADWYRAWPDIADEWEEAARLNNIRNS